MSHQPREERRNPICHAFIRHSWLCVSLRFKSCRRDDVHVQITSYIPGQSKCGHNADLRKDETSAIRRGMDRKDVTGAALSSPVPTSTKPYTPPLSTCVSTRHSVLIVLPTVQNTRQARLDVLGWAYPLECIMLEYRRALLCHACTPSVGMNCAHRIVVGSLVKRHISHPPLAFQLRYSQHIPL